MGIWSLMQIILLNFPYRGPAVIAATDNGYQADTMSFKSNEQKMLERNGFGNYQVN